MIEPANPRCEHLFRHIEKIVRKCFLDITTDLLCFPFYEMHYFSDVCEFVNLRSQIYCSVDIFICPSFLFCLIELLLTRSLWFRPIVRSIRMKAGCIFTFSIWIELDSFKTFGKETEKQRTRQQRYETIKSVPCHKLRVVRDTSLPHLVATQNTNDSPWQARYIKALNHDLFNEP